MYVVTGVPSAFQFHELYFSGKVSYWLNQVDKRIDNCDQRMTVEYVAGWRGLPSILPGFIMMSVR